MYSNVIVLKFNSVEAKLLLTKILKHTLSLFTQSFTAHLLHVDLYGRFHLL